MYKKILIITISILCLLLCSCDSNNFDKKQFESHINEIRLYQYKIEKEEQKDNPDSLSISNYKMSIGNQLTYISDIYEKTSSKDDKNYILNVVEEMINPSMYQNCINYIDKNDISDDIEKIYE